jgi:hypothetical protein
MLPYLPVIRHAAVMTMDIMGVLAQISTSLTKTGDFRGPALPSSSWWRFSPPWFRSWPFRFRSRASLELKLIAFQHQLAVLRH